MDSHPDGVFGAQGDGGPQLNFLTGHELETPVSQEVAKNEHQFQPG